jgi:hypothetical protein
MKCRTWFWVAISSSILACSLVSGPVTSPDGAGPSSPGQPLLPFMATATSVPSNPIGLRQGLASLNSYRLVIHTSNNGPTQLDKNETTFLMESASDGVSWHISNSTISSSVDDPEVSTSQSDQYKIGATRCEISGDDSEADKTDVDPQTQEIMDTLYGLMDMVPMVNDPVLIGSEPLNGVPTNHFQFKVNGLGVDSGAEVVASDGEYWLAIDGQYIVKYVVHLETRNGPAGDANAHTMDSKTSIEVRDINQPIVITSPVNCQ